MSNKEEKAICIPRVNKGYDPIEWVREVVLPKIKRDPENTKYIFPDPMPDFKRNSNLHSWYKHFWHNPGKVYPILRLGNEPGQSWDKSTDVENLHWAFIENYVVHDSTRGGYYIDNLPWDIMNNHYIQLSHYYHSLSLYKREDPADLRYRFAKFHSQCMFEECQIIQNRITRILLAIDPNPPSEVSLVYDIEIDPILEIEKELELIKDYSNYEYEYDSNKLHLTIKGKKYLLKWWFDSVDLDKYSKSDRESSSDESSKDES